MGQSPKGESVTEYGRGIEFHQGKMHFDKKYIKHSTLVTSEPSKIAPANSVLLCVRAPVGKVNITKHEICIGRGLCSIIPLGNMLSDFVYYFLLNYESILTKQATGTTFIAVTGEVVKNQLFPVPPIQEQIRIVAKIEELIPHIDEYDAKESKINELNSTFPEQLKKSILQDAVQGKLVPQDPSDEPASTLLERIREEKARLVKEGKIKKDKNESVIFRRDNSYYEKSNGVEYCIDEELPFVIPVSWGLIRLNDIGIYKKGPFGSSLTKSIFVPKSNDSVKVYEQKNAIQKNPSIGDYYISRKYYTEKMKGFKVEPGDIIVSCAGTIGETYVLPEGIEEGIINQALMRMSIFAPIDIDYFLLYFDYVLKQSAKKGSNGSAIKNIPAFDVFKKMLLPLPPLQEQKRIVNKVRQLQTICYKLATN